MSGLTGVGLEAELDPGRHDCPTGYAKSIRLDAWVSLESSKKAYWKTVWRTLSLSETRSRGRNQLEGRATRGRYLTVPRS